MIELLSCLPAPQEIVIRAEEPEAPGLLDDAIDFLMEPLRPLREQFIAITGFGLEVLPEDAPGVIRRTRTDYASGFSLSYLAVGDPAGRPVVFLHGSPGVAEEWGSFLVDVPAGQYRLAVDRPGFGETLPDAPVTSLGEQARAVRSLLGGPDDPKAVVVGYSYGGPVALRLAADYPERVGGVLLIGSAADPDQEEVHPLQLVAALDLFAQLLPQELHASNTELLALREELDLLAPELEDISADITIVQGAEDRLVMPENAFYLQDKLQENGPPRLVMIEQADHFLPWTHQDVLKQALDCLIAETAAGD